MNEKHPDLTELIRMQQEIADLREANRNLQRKMLKSKDKEAQLVEATFEGARDALISLGRPTPVKSPKEAIKVAKSREAEVALWVMGDWQLGKETVDYNTEVCKTRVMRFCDKAAKITAMHREVRPIKQCVVVFGGDMVEGAAFNFPGQPFEVDSTIFTQFVNTSRLLQDVVRYALSVYDEVRVVSEYGNHGRIGSKRDVLPRSDNFDRMCYHLAMEMLSNEHRLTWKDGPEDIQRLEIGAYRALVIHGDEIGRGGFSSPMTIVRHADRWASGAYPWEFTDVFIHHYHQHQEWGMANGRGHVYMTGSSESSNRYARDTMAASAIPSQRLHFVNPIQGRTTAQYQLYLED